MRPVVSVRLSLNNVDVVIIIDMNIFNVAEITLIISKTTRTCCSRYLRNTDLCEYDPGVHPDTGYAVEVGPGYAVEAELEAEPQR